MGTKVLFLASWYPTHIQPSNGNFIQKHAECVALHNDVRLIHVCINPKQQIETSQEIKTDPFYSQIIYLNNSSIPFLGRLINYSRVLHTYLTAIRYQIKQGFFPEIVHANVVFPIGIIALIIKFIYKVPYIITEHWTGFLPYSKVKINRIQKLTMRFVACNCSCLCPVSDDLKKAMQRHGLKADYQVVPNVVDTHIFAPKAIKRKHTKIQMLHISSLKEDQKNFRLLLQALANARKVRDDFELQVASDGIWEQYHRDIDVWGLQDILFFHGNLSTNEVAKLMNTSDFFVLSSNYENLPCVLVESLACGVPVISTKVGGIEEIVKEENGILVPPNDQEALTNALLKMLDTYYSYDKKIMHQNAVAQFSYESVGDTFSKIYNSTLKQQMD